MTWVGEIAGYGCLVFGGLFIWSAWRRRGWVVEDAVVISHDARTRLIEVSLGDPARIGSLPRQEDVTPRPGERMSVTHPPGDPSALEWHTGGSVLSAVGIVVIVIGVVVLLSQS